MNEQNSLPKITVEWVDSQIAEIRDARANEDFEVVSSLERALYRSVLSAIARGWCENPQAFARAALAVASIDGPRW